LLSLAAALHALDARLFDAANKSLTSGLVFTLERNKVTDLGDAPYIETGGVSGQGQSGRNAQRLIPGQPLGTFWGAKFLRVNGQGQQVFAKRGARAHERRDARADGWR
jgi:iron complex outermembrane receptor protein